MEQCDLGVALLSAFLTISLLANVFLWTRGRRARLRAYQTEAKHEPYPKEVHDAGGSVKVPFAPPVASVPPPRITRTPTASAHPTDEPPSAPNPSAGKEATAEVEQRLHREQEIRYAAELQAAALRDSFARMEQQLTNEKGTLEMENRRLLDDLEAMRDRHRKDVGNLLRDLEDARSSKAHTDSGNMTGLYTEIASLKADLMLEKDESQLLFLEVERLRHYEKEAADLQERCMRQDAELVLLRNKVNIPQILPASKTTPVSPISAPAPPPVLDPPKLPSPRVPPVKAISPKRSASPSPLFSPRSQQKLRKLYPGPASQRADGSSFRTNAIAAIDAAFGGPSSRPPPSGLRNPFDKFG